MREVQPHLTAIYALADACLREQAAVLTVEQVNVLQTILTNAQHCIGLIPVLDELRRKQGHVAAVTQMSTEWRTPLTSILGYCQIGRDDMGRSAPIAFGEALTQIQDHTKAVWNWSTPNDFAQLT